jgi:hypothetical protein
MVTSGAHVGRRSAHERWLTIHSIVGQPWVRLWQASEVRIGR